MFKTLFQEKENSGNINKPTAWGQNFRRYRILKKIEKFRQTTLGIATF